MNLLNAKDIAVAAALKANDAILTVYNNDDLEKFTTYKEDASPLTLADTNANAIITKILAGFNNNIPILSEESLPEISPINTEFCWIVDPLDGTKEFINRNNQFTTNIALVQNGEPIIGVVSVPVTGDVYYAIKNRGAYKISQGKEEEITVTNKLTNLTWVGSKSHSSEKENALIEEKKELISNTLSAGSSLKGLMVAEGTADVYYRFGYTSEWDTCAMQCIVEEAGGIFLQMDKTPMLYNRENHLNEKGFFIVNREENIWV